MPSTLIAALTVPAVRGAQKAEDNQLGFNVQCGAGEYGSFGVICGTAADAVETAHRLMAQGVAHVRIVDRAGTQTSVEDMGRQVFGHNLNAEQLALVASMSAVLDAVDDEFAKVFYGKLFETAPEVRAMFPDDMSGQRRKLIDTLTDLLRSATQPETFKAMVQGLGKRHVAYGTQPEHYGPVGHALIFALGDRLGHRFTAEAKAAWTILYLDLAAVMSLA